jgi:fatty acid/phospholipid biosynthesis enzyme
MKTVVVDAMGGDHAPQAVIEGAIAAARELSIPVTLVGDRDVITHELGRKATGLPISVRHASQVVEMEDGPVEACDASATAPCGSASSSSGRAKPTRSSVPGTRAR